MYYAGIGIIALIVLTIINIEAFKKVEKTKENSLRLNTANICSRWLHFSFRIYCGDSFMSRGG